MLPRLALDLMPTADALDEATESRCLECGFKLESSCLVVMLFAGRLERLTKLRIPKPSALMTSRRLALCNDTLYEVAPRICEDMFALELLRPVGPPYAESLSLDCEL